LKCRKKKYLFLPGGPVPPEVLLEMRVRLSTIRTPGQRPRSIRREIG